VSKFIWLNGNLVPPEQANISVFDHGLLYGDGVFEGIRIYNHRVFKLATHLKRLLESARSIRLTVPHSIEELAAATHATVKANGLTNGYIRLCVTRGAGTLGLNPFVCPTPSVFIIADTISLYPAELYDNGMAVITSSVVRNHPAALSPRVKSLNYLNNILAKIEAIDAGVLEGITMNTVLNLAAKAGIEIRKPDLTKHDLYIADEMFLTGTAAEVIPVTMVDNRPIGTGQPGPITRSLITAFKNLVADNAPED